MSRRRWIRIASVRSGWYVLAFNAGYPGGLLVNWRGELRDWQPFEFLTWRDFQSALRARLRLARLRVVAVASALPRQTYQPIWVEVERVKVKKD